MTARVVRLDELGRIPMDDVGVWRPVRRPLGVTAFGVNADTADAAGDRLIERHNETGGGAGRHEELYVVLRGHARFNVAGEEIDAPAGTFVFVQDPRDTREAVAIAPDSAVLALGGRAGAGLPVSPWEHYFAAQPAVQAGDYERAIEIVSEGLADHPGHGSIHYNLACYHALAGHRDEAFEHLERALAAEPRARDWAQGDSDLDSLRDDPRFPR